MQVKIMNASELVVDHEIVLVSLHESDAQVLWDLIRDNRSYLGRYLAWVEDVNDVSSTTVFIRQRVAVPGLLSAWYKVYVSGQLCGIFGAKSIIHGRAELGCFIAENSQGKGIINRCITYFSDVLVRDFGVREAEWRCLPENLSSIRVAERFGASLHATEMCEIAGSNQVQALSVYRKMLV
ncbi:GNAT family N-acetyltransferase [Aliamphritea hakodatensis]|uniref:GNAT family N-acetyltransferase n=1 Tax=Aliamphritea hakodatensis TaxID=2895352 RepID=UPI0022FD3D74|nr:GNAT family protein [Aliamphritea hakodatensis]